MKLARTLASAGPDLLREIVREDVYRMRQATTLKNGVVIDLGANIGVFSLYARKLGAARVFAVEPFPDNLEMLRENIAASEYEATVTVLEAAVVGRLRPLAMVCAGAQAFCENPPDADWMRRALSQPGEAPRVSTVTLSELMEAHSLERVAMLKVDVEGLEVEIVVDTPHEVLDRVDFISIEVDAHPPGSLGRLVEHLAETHHVEVLGSPRRGCYVYARRYSL